MTSAPIDAKYTPQPVKKSFIKLNNREIQKYQQNNT